ncbi:MAG: stage III sporulation protein AE [Eubacteriales bacterium]
MKNKIFHTAICLFRDKVARLRESDGYSVKNKIFHTAICLFRDKVARLRESDGYSVNVTDIFQQYGLDDLEQSVDILFPDWNLQIYELFQLIMTGNIGQVWEKVGKEFLTMAVGEIAGIKTVLVIILILGIVSGILSNFSDLFENHQVADIAFYINYIILIILLMEIFSNTLQVAENTLMELVEFVQFFLPTYFLTITAANGGTTAITYYQLMLFVVFFVERVLYTIFVPSVSCFMMLVILNGIWEEEKLTAMLTMVKKGISALLKGMVVFVMGIGMIQSMIAPVIDSLKTTAVEKTVTAIPGIGDLAGGAWQMVFTTAVLVKNSAGLLMMILLIVLCGLPLLKLFCIMVMLKGGAGFIGLIADKRMTESVNKVGDGVALLLQIVFTANVFFMILIAVAACTINR